MPARAAQRRREHDEADERDNERRPGRHCQHDERPTDHLEQRREDEEEEFAPGSPRERCPCDSGRCLMQLVEAGLRDDEFPLPSASS